jgi:pimeloyl-ACP methyl ester carboxylesterase
MYASFTKSTVTHRGFNYSFVAIEPDSSSLKPTLVFLHGFPSSLYDWHYQIEYFHAKGYGLVVPDLLGYGGTDKPIEQEAYGLKDISQDVMDVINSLPWTKTTQLIVVSHDWGAALHSRLNIYYQSDPRLIASAFLVVGGLQLVTTPRTDFDIVLPYLKQTFGGELIAYQEFLSRVPDATEVIEKNIDSFIDVFFPPDYDSWKTTLTVRGATEQWIRSDKRAFRGSYLTAEDAEEMKSTLLAGGMTGPLNWYRAYNNGVWYSQDKELVGKDIKNEHPVLYIGATRDSVCTPAFNMPITKQLNTNVEVSEIDAGHWIYFEKPDELNRKLEAFFNNIAVP